LTELLGVSSGSHNRYCNFSMHPPFGQSIAQHMGMRPDPP
jgi:hypothetical protein